VESSAPKRQGKKRTPQRAVPQSVRRSGKPLFFGWGGHLTHHEREQVKERIAAGIGIGLVVVIAGIIGWGLYYQNVIKPAQAAAARNKPVAQIGKAVITHAWYEKVLGIQQKNLTASINQYNNLIAKDSASTSKKIKAQATALQQYVTQLQSQESSLPSQSYQELIDNAVIEQNGASAGLHLSSAALAKYLHTVIYKQFTSPIRFGEQAAAYGISQAQLKSLFLMSYRYDKLKTLLTSKVPKKQFEVHVRHILIGPPTTDASTMGKAKYNVLVATDKALALRIQHELENGGSWKTLALKYSTDPGSKKLGGDYGWVGPTTYNSYVSAYKNAALHQQIGTIKVIHSQFGYHVFQVLGRGQHPLSATDLSTAQSSALQNWLTKEEAIKGYVQKFITPPAPASTGLSSIP
jgi:parvulin-like peptidyl-prolyl isomerase